MKSVYRCPGPARCRVLFIIDDVCKISPRGYGMACVRTRKWQERINSASLTILVNSCWRCDCITSRFTWCQHKMTHIFQKIFTNVFYWMKILTISQRQSTLILFKRWMNCNKNVVSDKAAIFFRTHWDDTHLSGLKCDFHLRARCTVGNCVIACELTFLTLFRYYLFYLVCHALYLCELMAFLSFFTTYNSRVIDYYWVIDFTHTHKHGNDIPYSEVEYKLLMVGLYFNCCDYFRKKDYCIATWWL